MKIKISDIQIGDRFRNSPGDVTSPARSIETLGLLEPIGVAAGDMTLIYGRRRVAAYTKLGIKEIEACMVPSNIDHRLAEVHENRERLAHTVEEIAAIDDYLREKFEAEARLRQKKGTKNNLGENFAKGKSSSKIAKILHVSDRQLEKIRAIKGSSTEGDFTQKIWEKVAAGKMKVDKGYNQIKRHQRIKEDEKLASSLSKIRSKNHDFDLQLGPMQELSKKILPNSIDMIFTDPPYKRPDLYLYGELAKLAQRVLKPGGSMVTFIGHYAIFEINDLIRRNSDLIFHWPIVVVHDGHIRRMHVQRVWPYHKPLLWYYKPVEGNGHGPTMYEDVADVIFSKAPVKDDHEWEQSTVEAEHLIKPLTVKGNVVLDPFMGSCTTGEAALNLGRKFIGIECDKIAYLRAQNRLTKLTNNLPRITL